MRPFHLLTRAVRAAINRSLDLLSTSYYRLVCAEFGQRSKIGWGTWISSPEQVHIGAFVRIGRHVVIGSEDTKSKLTILDCVEINDRVSLDFTGNVTVGARTLISAETLIFSHSHGDDPRSPAIGCGKSIGTDCWIGARCVLLEGCRNIGDGVIVGAGAVVTKDLPAHAKYAGIPAKPLERR